MQRPTESTDPHVVRDLFRRYAGPLVGVATGTISNIDLLDIDQKPEARQWWAENRHRMPPTRAHRTRSGGFVWCFSTPPARGIPPVASPAASIPEAMGGTASGGPPQGSRCCPTRHAHRGLIGFCRKPCHRRYRSRPSPSSVTAS